MAKEKQINSRFQQKHDIEANWNKAINFIPKDGELIIYDVDNNHSVPRIKIGDNQTSIIDLPFITEDIDVTSMNVMHGDNKILLSTILETYIFNIDYDSLLAFNTSEIVINNANTTSVLGQAILGQMVLA